MILIKRILYILSAFFLLAILILPTGAHAAAMDSRAGAVTTAGSNLNVRSSPSTAASVTATIPKGSHITLLSKSGSWWHVEFAKGRYGYCHADYITPIVGTPAAVRTQSANLNVRSGAGTSYLKTASLQRGETVIVLSTSGGWSRILFHGVKTGYVSAQYLSNSYSAVSLNVPGFKQTDSRWSEVVIGESGRTMAQIGCATTAIAMMESARTGTVIYPDAMAKRLSYTPSGSVYWPANYVTVTNGSGYLSGIYAQLRQGKPVLLGVSNAAGKQHWVVIRGFVGGSQLTASGFVIHDPGSSSRGNLQQLLDVYPVFYKYLHY